MADKQGFFELRRLMDNWGRKKIGGVKRFSSTEKFRDVPTGVQRTKGSASGVTKEGRCGGGGINRLILPE